MSIKEPAQSRDFRTPASDIKGFREAFASAYAAGTAAAEASEDGGTCNFDHARLLSRRSARVEAAIKAAGASIYYRERSKWWPSGYAIYVRNGGQGFKNTRAAEAITAALVAAGFSACTYYAVD